MRLVITAAALTVGLATTAAAGQLSYQFPTLTWPTEQTTEVPTRLCGPGTNVGDTATDCAPAE